MLSTCIDLSHAHQILKSYPLCSQHLWETLGLLWRGEGILNERIITNVARTNFAHSVKIAWFFNQQIEFLQISCLAVAKFYEKGVDIFLNFVFHQHVNIFMVVFIFLSLQKKIFFLPFHSYMFHLKIHKHTACKMNMDEHGKSRLKTWSFQWTYFLNDPKAFLLHERSIL